VSGLLDLPNTAARRLLAAGTPVFLPVNPVEYHGPHLSLHNDALVCAGYMRDLHARLWPETPFLAANDLEVGVDPVPGPGSRPVPFATVRRVVKRACAALADLGARAVVVATFHGSPLHNHALEAGVRLLRRRGVRAVAPFNLVARRLLAASGDDFAEVYAPVPDAVLRAQMQREIGLDYHAGFLETSLALHFAPESVDPRVTGLAPCPEVTPDRRLALAARAAAVLGREALAAELRFAAWGVGWFALRPFPGYTGRPGLANAESGARVARRMVDESAPVVAAVLAGRELSPAPIMPWLPAASLEGRLGATHVPPAAIRLFWPPHAAGFDG
jgi:creatinine amidohydrolase